MNMSVLEDRLGHRFRDRKLLETALTHPSFGGDHHVPHYQRLEFLGDAVLEICVSRVLYHKFPKLKEGQLTRRRASLVCEANLAEAARRFGLGAFLKLDRGEEVVGGRENPSILADTMEAVIAAVYLDAGMDKAAALVDLAMGDYESAAGSDRDAKSALQEYLQALGEETPSYEIIAQDGPLSYVVVCCEGPDNKNSKGLTLEEMGQFMLGLGVQTAYNLDGGGSTTMVFSGSKINALSTSKNRSVSDIVYFCSGVAK